MGLFSRREISEPNLEQTIFGPEKYGIESLARQCIDQFGRIFHHRKRPGLNGISHPLNPPFRR